MSLWTELRRRNVFKVAVAYAFVAWLLAQVAGLTFPALLFPDWVFRAFIVLLILLFPITLIIAWAFELTADGIRPTPGAPQAGSSAAPKAGGRKLNFVIMGLMATESPSSF